MFINYLKIALRNLKKHKGYSFINIAGLTIGIACCFFMLMWVQDEWSYDRFHENSTELYRILLDPLGASATHEAVSPPILAGKMKEEFPEVINTTRLAVSGTILFSYGDRMFYEGRGILADQSFFEMFTFPFVKGDPATAFSELHSIVITEDLAYKYFGSDDPIGKTLTLNNRADYNVTGVIKNVPHNSHFQFDHVRPFNLMREFGRNLDSWRDVSYYTYVLLQENSSAQEVNKKLEELIKKEDSGHNLYYLQPLMRIHLHSNFNFDIGEHGNVVYVYIFTAAAVFILLIACINFMNLTTARSGNRAKEVGMRKVIGARRIDIIKQFYGESILLSLIALMFAFLLISLFLPLFNNLTGKQLALDYSGNLGIVFLLVGIAIFAGIISGSYPALFLSSFRPMKVLKSVFKTGSKNSLFRKVLVVTQFTLTIVLFIGTMVIHDQLANIRGKDLGYDKDHLIFIRLRGNIAQKYETVKLELLQNPNIASVTSTSSLPTHIGSGTSGADWEGKEPDVRIQMQISLVDHDYLETFKMEMAQGRFFSKEFSTDKSGIVLNEAAIKAMGMDSPLGKRFSIWRVDGTIIGIIRNFHYKSLRNEIEPLILILDPKRVRYACIRIKAGNIPETIKFLENSWKKLVPDFPFVYGFLDDRIDGLYRAEQRMGTVFNCFTLLAIFIACLGLFGLASFMAEQRTKEIGIRKVLGAPVFGIVFMLSREFTKWVLVANIIAWPLAYFAMNHWLQNFAYRINIGIWTFLLAAVLVFVVALFTVSFQALKAALLNPVETLRYE